MIQPGCEIAVIGAGVAGLTCAHLLSPLHRVTIYEKNSYLGGHTNTIIIEDGPDAGTAVDTGFIVYNHVTYPTFLRLLADLGIEGQESDMSFGCSSEKDGVAYSSYVPRGLFAQRRDLVRPGHYRMILDIVRFNARAKKDLEAGKLEGQTLGDYIAAGNYSREFREFYLIPMGSAVWSTPMCEMPEFPAATFVRFFKNHAFLDIAGRPRWKTIPGGSHSYIKAMMKRFRGEVVLNAAGVSLRRTGEKVYVRTGAGEKAYDYAVVGAHADDALKLLSDPSPEERDLLGVWRYTRNFTILHTDESVMPSNRRAWASWNYTIEGPSRVSLTYDMNRLQALNTKKRYLVTLNRQKPVEKKSVIREINYTHPCYTFESVHTQPKLKNLNGVKRTFFCGSYFYYGFHEDAVKSAVEVAESFGARL